MRSPPRATDGRFAVLTLLVIAVIVYGSLYPFDFSRSWVPDDKIGALLATWNRVTSRGDIISNILLYVPLGLFAALTFGPLPAAVRIVLATLAGCALSVGVEIVQFYGIGRNSAMIDVYTNTGGAFLGAVAAAAIGPGLALFGLRRAGEQPFVALLIVAWLGYRLFPYVPVIDLHKYWDALKPLVVSPTLSPLDLVRHAGVWLVLALLVEALLGERRRRLHFTLLIAGVLAARVAIKGVLLSPAEVAGAALAWLIWVAALSHMRVRTAVVALAWAGVVAVQSLEPFQFAAPARPFGWIPFYSLMHGSMEVAIRAFLEKTFTYGALLWLLNAAGVRLGLATALAAGYVLALRMAQVYLPGRSAEITDAVMVVCAALVMWLVAPRTAGAPARRRMAARAEA